jgi:succinoglycan biosynthesis protein ExoA
VHDGPAESPRTTTPLLLVIPVLNEAEHIRPLVTQLLDDAAGLDLTIAVVDGGSTDGTPDLVTAMTEDPRVRLLPNPGRIQSRAVNLAVAALGDTAEYFLRIDAHSRYPQGFCRTLLEEARSTGADSVVVAMRTDGSRTFQLAAAAAQNSPLGNGGSAHRNAPADGSTGRWVDHGHHALMRVSAFRAVGGYDEDFTHNEDAELDHRLRQGGYSIWLTTRTSSTYFPRETPKALFRQYLNYGQGRASNVLKHRSVPKVRQMIPLMVVPALALALLARITRLAALPAVSWVLACLGYGSLLAVKERRPQTALAGPAAMIMHLGWSTGFWKRLLRR